MEVYEYHSDITQKWHGASRNYRYVLDVSVIFRPSRGPFILGIISTFVYLRPVTVIFCLWAKFSPWLQSARLWPVNTLGHFYSIIKYGLLTARYGLPIKRTISTLARLRPILRTVISPRIVRPMFGETIIRPIDGP